MRTLLFVVFFTVFGACAQRGDSESSGVAVPVTVTARQQKNLEILCRVWGFVKYFHPKAANGEVEMDGALFKLLPDALKADSDEALDLLLSNWTNSLGKVPVVPLQPLAANVFREATMPWLEKGALLQENLRQKLQYIYENRHRGNGHYASHFKLIGNPDFSNELPYKNATGKDGGMRMLSLFRYWNTIEYFFPSKCLTADNWDSVLTKFIPVFAAAADILPYHVACIQLASAIHDTHASAVTSSGIAQRYLGEYTIPATFEDIDGRMTLAYFHTDSLQRLSKLLPGDQVLSVQGIEVEKIVDSIKSYITASNISSMRVIAFNRIRRSCSRQNKITILRGGKTMEVVENYLLLKDVLPVYRENFSYPMFKKINDDIGYISLGKIKADSLGYIFKTFENTKGLIIDIRIYPKEFVPFALGAFLKPAPSAFVKFTAVDMDLPGRFLIGDPVQNGTNNPNYYKGKVVILVNANTMSQAEYTAMALRTAPGAVVMGSQTSGADGNVSPVFLPGGITTSISGLGVYYPDGKITQGIGIVPDIEVKRTVKGVIQGRDELMEAAIQYIRK
jgi:hypothetical protein